MIATIIIGTLLGYATYTTKRIYDLENRMVDLKVSKTCPECFKSPEEAEDDRRNEAQEFIWLCEECLYCDDLERPYLVDEVARLRSIYGMDDKNNYNTEEIYHEKNINRS